MSAFDHECRLMASDEHYRDLWILKKNLEMLLANWETMPTRPLEPHYRERLGDYDYIIGNFCIKKHP